MKTKLLKKIRKQYEIVKVEKIASDAGSAQQNMVEEYGLPFYILYDYTTGWGDKYCKDYNDAHEKLMDKILNRYSEKFRHNDGVYKKVWYTNKK